jgi:CheY-like chemotaxis protein
MSSSSPGAPHAQRREAPKTILVADDDPAIRKALCEMFEIEEDYEKHCLQCDCRAILHRPFGP